MGDQNYYEKELAKLEGQHVKVKFYGESDSTKTMDLNTSSMEAIVNFLTNQPSYGHISTPENSEATK